MLSAALALLAVVGCTSPADTDPKRRPGGDTPEDTSIRDTGEATLEVPAGATVLDHVRVVDAGTVREDAAVILVGDTIWDVREAGGEWPEDATIRTWDEEVTVIPGLIDAHVHLFHSGATYWVGDTLADNLAATLAWGVLGVADLGSPVEIFDVRDRVAEGTLRGPRIWAAGPMITAEGSHPCETTYDAALCRFVDGDGAEVAAELAEADGLKVALADAAFTEWPTPRLDLGDLATISAAAGDAGQAVWAHVDTPEDARDAVDNGVTVLAHPVFSEALTDAADLPDAPVHSTIGAFDGPIALYEGRLLSDDVSHTPTAVIDAWTWLSYHPEAWTDGFLDGAAGWAEAARANTALAASAGRTVLAGSDAGYWLVPHGLGLHRELAELVAAGMTPQEALAAATAAPADALGWEDMGWVAAGYRADLVVVRGRPDEDIAAARAIAAVYQGGIALDGEDIWVSEGDGEFCLDDADCTGGGTRCDLLDHTCRAACDTPWTRSGACDGDTYCAPQEWVTSAEPGVCHPGDACDLYAQDCEPAYYDLACVPVDSDTNACWPSGTRGAGESCDPSADPCAPGLFCSWVDSRCYELCDPTGRDTCSTGTCRLQRAPDGTEWFGACL